MPKQLTPMMRHYVELKEKYKDCLLFYRLGDFYEMFFEDAITASKELDLVLTGRDCGQTEKAPMCGVPHHSVDNYIARLVEKGYKVAICEQLEDPALCKGLVERDVIRVITPGTVIEEKMLTGAESNFIAAIRYQKERIGLAYAEVSTGDFLMMEFAGASAATDLLDELLALHPREVLADDALFSETGLVKRLSVQYYLSNYGAQAFQLELAKRRLTQHFGVASLDGFGLNECNNAVCAAGALMQYLSDTQKNALSHINRIRLIHQRDYMHLDIATRRNLELTQPLRQGGSKKHTLVHLLDRTKTAMGARLLREWMEHPLIDKAAIESRLAAVNFFYSDLVARKQAQESLSKVYDIERLTSKIAYGTLTARDCIALRDTLTVLPGVCALIESTAEERLRAICDNLDPMEDIRMLLQCAITDEPPTTMKEGGYIRTGFHQEVDELREIRHSGKSWLTNLECEEREKTGIAKLKIGYNRVFGYYFEVTKSNLAQVPYYFERRQTLANAERFITPPLKELEEKILGAEERLFSLEAELFEQLRTQLLEVIDRLQLNASLIAELDIYQAFAEVAAANRYCRPDINEDGRIRIEGGRHPVIEQAQQESFVPNDVLLDNDENRLLIITGPNMAGKSTYMRQIALMTLMAHIGSYVPALRADIALVDRIFTRIGASDDLSSGQSTFMVEMSEMANILHNATDKSLLIIDEIGRGTSTFDGLSIAWSVLEHIADAKSCGAKTLFATHYHELTELEGKLAGVKNYRIMVREIGEDIVFLRKIVRGGGDKSFGIQVARLAGIPEPVLTRAKEILLELESADIAKGTTRLTGSEAHSSLPTMRTPEERRVIEALECIQLDQLTPLQALNQLYQLCAILDERKEQGR